MAETEAAEILVLGDVSVDVVFKDIRNVHLSVYPPTGRVRIAAPTRMSLDTIRVFAISKLGWIRAQQGKLERQPRETPREYLDRESHYVWGRRYLLRIREADQAPSVDLSHSRFTMTVRPGADAGKREEVLEAWYRERLAQAARPIIARWEPALGVEINRLLIQRMKTKWGSCNPASRNIRLNTELAKKPLECLEYVLVHELAHLLVPRHDDRFRQTIERCLPNWRQVRQTLNSAPLAHGDWMV